jgi:RNA polymerase sigma-70 factor, ECF subfamily
MAPPSPDVFPDPSPIDDDRGDDLVGRLRDGDRSALDEALERYWGPAVRYATRLTGHADDAQDIAQDAFLRLWEGAESWREDSAVGPLVLGIVRNLALRANRRQSIRESHAQTVRRAPRSHGPDPSDDVAARELERAIARAVQRLPRRRQEIFTLSRQEGLSHRQIAAHLGVSPQTVANQLVSALRELRTALRPYLRGSTPKPDLRVVAGQDDSAR